MLAHLNQRATLLSRVLTPDGGGGFTESWQTVGQAWIKITPIGTEQTFGPDTRETRIRHRIVLRARDDVVAGMCLVTDGRTFAIRAVLDREAMNPFLTMLCEELP
jgi:SPP1 family predicted phage head-tail adaptor